MYAKRLEELLNVGFMSLRLCLRLASWLTPQMFSVRVACVAGESATVS